MSRRLGPCFQSYCRFLVFDEVDTPYQIGANTMEGKKNIKEDTIEDRSFSSDDDEEVEEEEVKQEEVKKEEVKQEEVKEEEVKGVTVKPKRRRRTRDLLSL